MCLEASLRRRSRVFLPSPRRFAPAAVRGLAGGSPALSAACESAEHRTSLPCADGPVHTARCFLSRVPGQRRGPVVAPTGRPVLLVAKRLLWSRAARLRGRKHLLLQQHRDAGETCFSSGDVRRSGTSEREFSIPVLASSEKTRRRQ